MSETFMGENEPLSPADETKLRLRGSFDAPEGVSLVDELFADRKREAEIETSKGTELMEVLKLAGLFPANPPEDIAAIFPHDAKRETREEER